MAQTSSERLAEEGKAFVLERREYLGITDVAALLNKSDRGRTALDVYREKVGLADYTETPDSKRGKKLEAIAAEEWSEATGKTVVREPKALIHPRLGFLRGHLDFRVKETKRPLEIKCPRSSRFHRIKGEGLPASHIIQGQGYALLDEAPSIDWGIFCADVWVIIPFTLTTDKRLGLRIEDAADRFWNEHVLPMKPPKAVNDADKENLELDKVGGELEIRDDMDYLEAGRLLREAKRILDDGDELFELAKQRVLLAIANKIGKYQGGCLRLNYFETKGRTSFKKDRLIEAKPLDLPKVAQWLSKEFGVINDTALIELLVTECGLDISEFQSRGEPYPVFRPTYIETGD